MKDISLSRQYIFIDTIYFLNRIIIIIILISCSIKYHQFDRIQILIEISLNILDIFNRMLFNQSNISKKFF